MVCRQTAGRREDGDGWGGGGGGKNTPPGSGPAPRPWLREHLKFQTRQAHGRQAPGPSQAARPTRAETLGLRAEPLAHALRDRFLTMHCAALLAEPGHSPCGSRGGSGNHWIQASLSFLGTGVDEGPNINSAGRPLSGPRVREEGCAENCGLCSESSLVQPEHPGNSGETPLKGCTARKAHKTAGRAASDYSNNLIKRNCLLGHGGWEGN